MMKDNEPWRLAHAAWFLFSENNPTEPAECAFYVGFALAMTMCREMAYRPTQAACDLVSRKALELALAEENPDFVEGTP